MESTAGVGDVGFCLSCAGWNIIGCWTFEDRLHGAWVVETSERLCKARGEEDLTNVNIISEVAVPRLTKY